MLGFIDNVKVIFSIRQHCCFDCSSKIIFNSYISQTDQRHEQAKRVSLFRFLKILSIINTRRRKIYSISIFDKFSNSISPRKIKNQEYSLEMALICRGSLRKWRRSPFQEGRGGGNCNVFERWRCCCCSSWKSPRRPCNFQSANS